MLDAIPIAHPTGGVTIIEQTSYSVSNSAWSGSNHTGLGAVVNFLRVLTIRSAKSPRVLSSLVAIAPIPYNPLRRVNLYDISRGAGTSSGAAAESRPDFLPGAET